MKLESACVKLCKERLKAGKHIKIPMMNEPVKHHVLLVDDDREFSRLLREYIEQYEFTVSTAHDGVDGLGRARELDPDIVVLDIMMPEKDGISMLRELREQSNVPVIMLTARGDDVDRIVGLELGADDYLAKPCNPRELVARLRALLRRHATDKNPALVSHGDLVLDPGTREASLDNSPLSLTSTEFSLLQCLLENIGRVMNKADLYQAVLGRSPARYDRTVDMHISNLRRKLGPWPNSKDRFETIRGVGYQLTRME